MSAPLNRPVLLCCYCGAKVNGKPYRYVSWTAAGLQRHKRMCDKCAAGPVRKAEEARGAVVGEHWKATVQR